MLAVLCGSRNASNCKKVMNKLQCRLKLLRCNLNTSVKQLREEIDLLSRNGNHHLAYTKIEKLCMGENLKHVYELLDSYCGIVLTNLSYTIKRHSSKCPNDVKEAVSSLIFASAWVQELPELKELRVLFEDKYGYEFTSTAAELLPGNLVNSQLKGKVLMKTVPEDEKSRFFDEILQDSLFVEALGYSKIEPPQLWHGYDRINSPMVMAQSSPSIVPDAFPLTNEDAQIDDDETFSLPSPYPLEYPEQELVYLDDIEEFKSPARKGASFLVNQDHTVFVFTPSKTQKADQPGMRMRSRQRRRSSSTNDYIYKQQQPIKDDEFEVYYSKSPSKQRKHQKKAHENDAASLARYICKQGEVVGISFRHWLNKEETETLSRSRNSSSSRRIQIGTFLPNESCRGSTRVDGELNEFKAATYMESPVEVSRNVLSSPSHVHPKLPDYDELEAMFKALKNKIISRANLGHEHSK